MVEIKPPRFELPSAQAIAGASEAMGRWAHRTFPWWSRRAPAAVTPESLAAAADAPTATEEPPVLLEIDGPIATVTLNRPERRNALSLAVWRALRDVAARLMGDPAVRIVILRGAGDAAFSAGSDVTEFPTARLGAAAARHYNEVYEPALEAWSLLPQPVIARVRGFCLGAATELALTADFRFAAEDAVFGIPAVKLGIGISVSDARRLIDVVGVGRARALLLTGERLTAERAAQIGLVDEVLPADRLDAHIQTFAQELLANAPHSMTWVKRVVAHAAAHPGEPAVPFDSLGTQVFDSRDSAEGVAAFIERRRPSFTGS
ncbi:MAG TPA: enoyl-CoA hydratase-related protein [Chloroflexota bacterium]|nr:enoyl-CoA hydratase-related protein [Chloroflexota bacterium]